MTDKPAVDLPEPAGPTRITVCPDGPLLIRGPVEIVDDAGRIMPRSRPTIALCRCGKSRIAPLCDGTHKMGNSRARTSEPATTANSVPATTRMEHP
jgi:CDGSH-type Zn-finger protein